jgi:NADPH2:quinone reductase
MRAVLCKAYGPPESLVVEDVADPAPGPGEVVLSVAASSVNFPDVLIIENKYQVKPPLPFSPGCEAAGVVSQIGSGVDRVTLGDRVMAITGYGAFAEKVVVSANRLVTTPPGMGDEIAGAFLFTYTTSDHAVRDRGELKAGETLLVLGAAGGVGLAAVEIGKAVGATVIACASSDEKLAVCREHGADATINYSAEDLRERIKQLTSDRGVDVVLDPVGGRYSEPALRSITWRGRMVVVGFAAGEIPRIPLNLALLKGSSIVGSTLGGWIQREPQRFAESTRQLLQWYEEGRLKPRIDRTFPLERAAEAIAYMAGRRVKGKIAVTTSRQR